MAIAKHINLCSSAWNISKIFYKSQTDTDECRHGKALSEMYCPSLCSCKNGASLSKCFVLLCFSMRPAFSTISLCAMLAPVTFSHYRLIICSDHHFMLHALLQLLYFCLFATRLVLCSALHSLLVKCLC